MTRVLLTCSLLLAACQNLHATSSDPEVVERDCFTCHAADYEAAPNHPGVKPTTCADCHTTETWAGVHPEHIFAITTGPHAGATCESCHKTELGANSGGENTDCINCHAHNSRADLEDEHDDEDDFVWDESNPNSCLSCHPDGRNRDD
jgi:hypothetical protein